MTAPTLLALPRELRDRIYEFVVFSQQRDELAIEAVTTKTEDLHKRTLTKLEELVKSYTFIFTHPQIFEEAKALIVETHPLIISHFRTLKTPQTTTGWASKTSDIVLDCQNRDPWPPASIDQAITHLSSFPALQNLEIRLDATYETDEYYYKLHVDPLISHLVDPSSSLRLLCPGHAFPALRRIAFRDPDLAARVRRVGLSAATEGTFSLKREVGLREGMLRDLNSRLEVWVGERVLAKGEGMCCCGEEVEGWRVWREERVRRVEVEFDASKDGSGTSGKVV